jgi:TPR repeat protein
VYILLLVLKMDTLMELIHLLETNKNNGDKYYNYLYKTLRKDLYFTNKFLSWIHSSTNSSAQLCLAIMYDLNSGVIKNQEEIMKLLKSSADQGNPYAQYELGFEHLHTYNNYGEACKWLKLSADTGNSYALSELGDCYRYGWGVSKDWKMALKMYEQSALKNNHYGQHKLGEFYYHNKNYHEALKWYMKSMDKHDESLNKIGCMYHNGLAFQRNYKTAFKYYTLAAKKGNSYAYANLGLLYMYGDGVKQNYKKALMWNKLSANDNNGYGQMNLGIMYRDGLGIRKHTPKALKLFELSAKQGIEGAKEHYDKLLKEKKLKDKKN